jgi:anti-sigma factor RsiW
MKAKCCEIGDIQAFLDGELSPVESARVTDHIADCDACTILLTHAEEEISVVFPALEREMDTLVPTHRLWTRINESIVEEQKQIPYWRRFLDSVLVQFVNPSIAAAAGVLIIFGLFAGVWSLKSTNENEPVPVASSNGGKDTVAAINPRSVN